ncbi:MAG: hypothetical protein MMC33_005636 [Icmadophila ericetorum]|nr:hypothetical protein [Icmadophila ericetorum]
MSSSPTQLEPISLHSIQAIINKLYNNIRLSALANQVTPSSVQLTFYNAFLVTFLFLALKVAVTVIYRLYFSPLAKFPGPKIAALSRLYEFWYQGIKRTEFPDVIKEMHRVYGPIVRISPFELSINDSEFNAGFFLHDRKLDKDPWYYGLGFTESLFTLLDKDKHRHRQSHLAPSFSGSQFKNAEPTIERELKKLLSVFELEVRSSEGINLSVAFRKMGNEILRSFLMGERGDSTAPVDYMKDADVAYHPVFKTMTYVRHFPILYKLHALIPNWFYDRWLPLAKYQRDADDHVRYLVREHDKSDSKSEDDGLLYNFVELDPSYRKNNLQAAVEEFTALQWGGREVLGHGLTNISFHLVSNPKCMAHLYEELRSTDINISKASYAQLQTFPYLNAVCKEGLRTQLGGSFRIPRTSSTPITYKSYTIPALTPVSMCPKFFHDDEAIFPDHLAFKPERWLQGNTDELDKYWKPFGNGSRSCIGMNLALEVVYRAVANIFLRYDVSFHDGIDVGLCRQDGMLKVFPHKNSRGLVVDVRER